MTPVIIWMLRDSLLTAVMLALGMGALLVLGWWMNTRDQRK